MTSFITKLLTKFSHYYPYLYFLINFLSNFIDLPAKLTVLVPCLVDMMTQAGVSDFFVDDTIDRLTARTIVRTACSCTKFTCFELIRKWGERNVTSTLSHIRSTNCKYLRRFSPIPTIVMNYFLKSAV